MIGSYTSTDSGKVLVGGELENHMYVICQTKGIQVSNDIQLITFWLIYSFAKLFNAVKE